MLKNKEFIITLTGPSGSGKSTIEKMLIDQGFKQAISHTSRDIRSGELDGVNYYYVSKEHLLELYDSGKLAEFIEYNGNYYGVSVDELLKSQVIVVEPSGYKQIKEKMKDKKQVISFFLNISPEVMRKRMESRGDNINDIEKRIENDIKHFNVDLNEYDYVINVDNLLPSQVLNAILDILRTRI